MGKENKSKNAFQNDEFNALNNTLNMKNVKLTKNINAEDRNITNKIYILSNVKQIWRKLKKENNKINLNKI